MLRIPKAWIFFFSSLGPRGNLILRKPENVVILQVSYMCYCFFSGFILDCLWCVIFSNYFQISSFSNQTDIWLSKLEESSWLFFLVIQKYVLNIKTTLTWTIDASSPWFTDSLHTVGWPWHWRWSSFKNSSSCKATSTVLLCVLYLLLLMKGHFSFQYEKKNLPPPPQPDFFSFPIVHIWHMDQGKFFDIFDKDEFLRWWMNSSSLSRGKVR